MKPSAGIKLSIKKVQKVKGTTGTLAVDMARLWKKGSFGCMEKDP